MKDLKVYKLFLLILICIFLSACETLQVNSMNTSRQFFMEDDERRLRKRAEEGNEVLNKSGFIYEDKQLTNYANQLLDKLVGDYEKINNVDLKIYILKDPIFNAFCTDNGIIYIHTSLLANIDNEAQLAVLLGHEAAHFLKRHHIRGLRSAKNKSAFLSFWTVTFGSASGVFGDSAELVRLLGEYFTVGAFYGYSRDMEREADQMAFELVRKAGYDVRESKKFMERLYEAIKEEKIKVPYFYSTHPKTKERIRTFDRLIKNLSKENPEEISGIVNSDIYNTIAKNSLFDAIELHLKCNTLKMARREIEKYNNLYPSECRGHYILGKLLILEDKKEEGGKELRHSIELDPNYPESHKALGMLYYKNGNKEKAKQEFESYLQLRPDAADVNYIREYLNEEKS